MSLLADPRVATLQLHLAAASLAALSSFVRATSAAASSLSPPPSGYSGSLGSVMWPHMWSAISLLPPALVRPSLHRPLGVRLAGFLSALHPSPPDFSDSSQRWHQQHLQGRSGRVRAVRADCCSLFGVPCGVRTKGFDWAAERERLLSRRRAAEIALRSLAMAAPWWS